MCCHKCLVVVFHQVKFHSINDCFVLFAVGVIITSIIYQFNIISETLYIGLAWINDWFKEFHEIFLFCFTEPMYAIACPGYTPAGLDVQDEMKSGDTFSLKDLIGDGILWAVPKHRKSLERRMKAKFGHPTYHMKTIPVKTTLRICMQCGHDHEVGILCRKCQSRNYLKKYFENN